MAGRKANFQWESAPAIAAQVFANTASNVVSFQSLGTFQRPGTLRRLIVDWFVMMPSVADGANAAGRVGIIIVAPQVVAVGATAVPRPVSDGERPWLWNRGYGLIQQQAGTDLLKSIPLHLHDDVRGMRKYKENDVLICVIENALGSSIDTFASVRILEST